MMAKLLPLIPPHHTYVEPFGGSGALLFAKRPSPVEVYNDVDEGLVNFFRVLADPKQFEAFYRRVSPLPYSRQLYGECHKTWREQADPVERAVQWFVVARQSFSGNFGRSWSFSVMNSRRGMACSCSKWLSTICNLPEIHTRLQRVQIEHDDWRTILDTYDTPETCFYMDPTYPHESRSAGEYAHELTKKDHEELVKRVQSLQAKVLLSTYPNSIYPPLADAGWTRIEWQTVCSAAGHTRGTGIKGNGAALRMQPRTEVLWRNPAAMVEKTPLLFPR